MMDPPSNSTDSSAHLFHFISGSFRSLSLFLLAFDPALRVINHVQTISTLGPHQYLATNQHKDRVFTTSWAQPPSLQSWIIECDNSNPWRISHLDTVPITATSSYIDIPPPFTHIYSVGGPTGEVHPVDVNTGGFGKKTQEILFVPEDQLPLADKTRVALRYGSHGIDSASTPSYSLTFVPVLGTNTIEIYSRNLTSGSLTHLSSSPSPRGPSAHDGPRHVKVHPNGKVLYCVTEHSNFVDLYEIDSSTSTLNHITSRSLLPDNLQSTTSQHQFRGDTLLLTPPTPAHPSPYALFTTTRGSTPSTLGWLTIFALDENGYFLNDNDGLKDKDEHPLEAVIRYETRSSGGKANAIDLLTKRKVPSPAPKEETIVNQAEGNTNTETINPDTKPHKQHPHAPQVPLNVQARSNSGPVKSSVQDVSAWQEEDQGVWILLTDDDETSAASSNPRLASGGVKVLEWDGWGGQGIRMVAEWPEPMVESGSDGETKQDGESDKAKTHSEKMVGGSHAIWLA